jgi:tetrapyrrole methylase family protein/MazG family protein
MSADFDHVVSIMARLRAPGGCPWDRKQSHESLKPYLLEETYEALEAIDHQDFHKMKEELGDVLLQVLFHSQIGTEAGTFSIEDVLRLLSDKLIRRHPHVFGDQAGEASLNPEQVVHRWEEIKRAERMDAGKPESLLQDVPKALPALLRAYQVQARAARVGFDWPESPQGLAEVFGKVSEELKELHEAVGAPSAGGAATPEQIAEFGDLLFSLVNLARHLKINPEDSLRQATNRFTDRFQYIERQASLSGRTMPDLGLAEMDRLWEEAKRSLAGAANERSATSEHSGKNTDARS